MNRVENVQRPRERHRRAESEVMQRLGRLEVQPKVVLGSSLLEPADEDADPARLSEVPPGEVLVDADGGEAGGDPVGHRPLRKELPQPVQEKEEAVFQQPGDVLSTGEQVLENGLKVEVLVAAKVHQAALGSLAAAVEDVIQVDVVVVVVVVVVVIIEENQRLGGEKASALAAAVLHLVCRSQQVVHQLVQLKADQLSWMISVLVVTVVVVVVLVLVVVIVITNVRQTEEHLVVLRENRLQWAAKGGRARFRLQRRADDRLQIAALRKSQRFQICIKEERKKMRMMIGKMIPAVFLLLIPTCGSPEHHLVTVLLVVIEAQAGFQRLCWQWIVLRRRFSTALRVPSKEAKRSAQRAQLLLFSISTSSSSSLVTNKVAAAAVVGDGRLRGGVAVATHVAVVQQQPTGQLGGQVDVLKVVIAGS